MKRSIDLVEDICAEMRPAKRLSMITNTPKQWKEQRRQILRMSKNKLKALGDVESNLRKSVLINNTYRKMRRELKEQCPYTTNVGFAPYMENRVSNPPKTNNGYTSMAKDDLYQATNNVCDDIAVSPIEVSMRSYKYSSLLDQVEEQTRSIIRDSNNADILGDNTKEEPMQSGELSVVDDDNKTSASLPKDERHQSVIDSAMSDDQVNDLITNNQLSNTDIEKSHGVSHQHQSTDPTSSMDTTVNNTTPVTQSDTTNNNNNSNDRHILLPSCSEPIDFSLKGNTRTSVVSSCSSGQLREHSPLGDCNPRMATAMYHDQGGSNAVGEPCVDSSNTMDVDGMTPQPSERGHVSLGENQLVSDNASQNDIDSNTSEAIDHSTPSTTTTSVHDEDFSLCKYANNNNKSLHNFCPFTSANDIIPFSTSSLVSILASREYAAQYRAPFCAENPEQSIQSTTSKDSTMMDTNVDSTPAQSMESTTTAVPTSAPVAQRRNSISDPVNLFSLEDLESLEESLHSDNKSTDNVYEPFISCDNDTHLWQAAYQTFNMAVACS